MNLNRNLILKLYKDLLKYSQNLKYTDKLYYKQYIRSQFEKNKELSNETLIDLVYKVSELILNLEFLTILLKIERTSIFAKEALGLEMKNINRIFNRFLLNNAEKRRVVNRFHGYKLNYSTSQVNDKNEKGCCKVTDNLVKEIVTLGQPTYWTHPHMFDSNSMANQDVTPGISKQEFEKRRDKYVEFLTNYQNYCFNNKKQPSLGTNIHLDESNPGKTFIAIIPSNVTTFMAPDVPYTFKQNSDFLYLTGFKEPNSLLVISRTNRNNSSYTAALFVREKDIKKEVWEGAFTGPENINKLCGIEKSFELTELEAYVSGLLKENENKKIVLWRYPSEELSKEESNPNCYNEFAEETINKIYADNCDKVILSNELNENSVLNTSRYFVQLARIKKSKAEISIMRKSCEIASDSFIKTMLASHPGCNESLIYAKFDYETRIRGAEYLAYIPVIAGGPRATILHYIRNNQIISNNHLLLMDAGCLYRDYVSDITRTWPINGRFSSPQRDIYEACLNVQLYCLDKCRKGISISKLYAHMINKIAEQLILLGIIKANQVDLTSDKLNFTTQKVVSRFCPHDIGHYLGLDVHDSPEIGKSIELDSGTVITIEPGIYIRHDDETVPAKYRGIGIRIEDDVVLTDNGYEVLSKSCPKSIEEIENLINIKKA